MKLHNSWYAKVCCLVLTAMTFLGCGGGTAGEPVTGTVTYEGKPLSTGTVVFRPDSKKGNSSKQDARGAIDAQGQYTLKTNDLSGAAPGWYQVGVSASEPDPMGKSVGGMPPPAKSLIPAKYSDPATSGLIVEVTEKSPPGAYDLKLTR